MFAEALAGAGALALLAAAGPGAASAQSETRSPAEASMAARVDPLHWGDPPKSSYRTSAASSAADPLDTLGQSCATGESSWMRLGEVLPRAVALGLLAAALEAVRRRWRRRKRRLQTLFELVDTPDETSATRSPSAESEAPRFLPSNPFLDRARPRWLGRQIENAAEASLEFDRVLGVVYFDLGDPPAEAGSRAAAEWSEAAAQLVFSLQGGLRPTDHVALLEDRYLVVCIALLPGQAELVGIGERVRGIGQTSPAFAAAFARRAGLSIFPLCGYRGEELIDYARKDFRVRNAMDAPDRLRLAAEIEPTNEAKT